MIFKSRWAEQKMDKNKCPNLQKVKRSWKNASLRP